MPVDGLSLPHTEYRRAKERDIPVLAFIRGNRSVKREEETVRLLDELNVDGPTYQRFGNVIELQKEVREALVALLDERFGISPTTDENSIAESTIEATSAFESRPLDRIRWRDLDLDVARTLIASAERCNPDELSNDDLLAGAVLRGLSGMTRLAGTLRHRRRDRSAGERPVGCLSSMPDSRRFLPEHGTRRDPRDHEDIRGPMPLAIERAIDFIDRNTRHPMRIVGLNRVRLDEYPVDGLREALVNAVAHRQYEDAGRKIILEVFADRIVISSPGLPPRPITLAGLRRGKYRPCSRNPVLAQCLSYFHRIEERGSGFRRMRDHMLNHGLDLPLLSTEMGYFQVTFPVPARISISCGRRRSVSL
jgi:predicted HTH transcriptional regulator